MRTVQAIALVFALLVAPGAYAGTFPAPTADNFSLVFTIPEDNVSIDLVALSSWTDLGGGLARFKGQTSRTGFGSLVWSAEVNMDPVVSVNFTFRNTQPTPVEIVLLSDLEAANVPNALMGGAVVDANIFDNNFNGSASLTTAGLVFAPTPDSFYAGQIDGTDALYLLPSSPGPFTVSCTGFGCNQPFSASQGLDGSNFPTIPAPSDPTNNISLRHHFILSTGDTVNIQSFFRVEENPVIPEPGTGLLLGVGLAGAAALRRRS